MVYQERFSVLSELLLPHHGTVAQARYLATEWFVTRNLEDCSKYVVKSGLNLCAENSYCGRSLELFLSSCEVLEANILILQNVGRPGYHKVEVYCSEVLRLIYQLAPTSVPQLLPEILLAASVAVSAVRYFREDWQLPTNELYFWRSATQPRILEFDFMKALA